MTSGKKARKMRQVARTTPPPVRAKGARRQASPRVLAGGAGIAAAIVVAIVLAVVLSRGSSSSLKNVPTVGSIAHGLPQAAVVNSLFKGVPQRGTTLGSSGAPVTMVEFIDLQCPFCRDFETEVFPDVVERYVRTGKLQVVMEPWAFIGPDSLRGQAAVLAAAGQNRAFNYAELLYDNQGTENTGWLNDNMVASAAASIPGLRVQQLLADRTSAAVKAEAQQVDKLVQTDNVRVTPTLIVGRSGTRGRQVVLKSPTDEPTLVRAIKAALR